MSAPVSAAAARPVAIRPLFAALMLVMLLSALDQTIVSTALPTMVSDLGGLRALSWVVTAYLLSSTLVTPLYGKFGDQFGRKRVLQCAIALFLLGSALCGLARTMTALIWLRGLQGLGGGGLMVVTMAAIGDVVAPERRARYQGWLGGAYALATVIGPLLGGFMVEHLSWRWIFYINLPLGLLAMAVIARIFPAHASTRRHRIDYRGISLLSVGLAAIVGLCTDSAGWQWNHFEPWFWLSSALVALGGFIHEERLAEEPVLPLELFRQRSFALSTLISLIIGVALFGSITFLPLYMQSVQGLSPTRAGLQMLPLMGTMLLVSILSGQWISRHGRYRWHPVLGTLLQATGMALISRIGPDTPLRDMNLYMAIVGAGLGLAMQVLTLSVQNSVERRHMGVAVSGVSLFRSVGGCAGVALLGTLFNHVLSRQLADSPLAAGMAGRALSGDAIRALPAADRSTYIAAFTHAVDVLFGVAAAAMALAFALTWLIRETTPAAAVEAA